MSEKKLKNLSEVGVHLNHGNKIPLTRRDFLTTGILGLSAFAIAPSLMMTSKNVSAQAVADEFLGVGFLSFEGAGGMNIAGGNVMVGFAPDEEQENYGSINYSDYILLGLPPSMHPSKSGMINKDYGIVFHSTSGILAGLNKELVPDMAIAGGSDLRDSIDGILICGRTADDSADNPINVAFQIQKAGSKGKLVQLIGDTVSPSGSRSPASATQIRTEMQSSRITKFSEGSGLLSIGADAINANFLNLAGADGKGTARIQAFLSSITGLSKVKLDTYINKKLETTNILNTQNTSKDVFQKFSPTSLNPANDAALYAKIKAAFGTNAQTGAVLDEPVAAVANLVTERIAGVGSVTVGGCDYHTGNASSGLMKDAEIGSYIGRCIKLAAAKGQSLFIHLYTDGGVGGDNAGTTDDTAAGAGRVNWAGDNGTTSSQLCIVYKHNHKRSKDGSLILSGKTRQVGYFKQGGGNNLTATSVSNNVDQMWKAVVLNYLACMSTENPDNVVADVQKRFKDLFPAESLPQDSDKLIRFKSIIKA
jgi:hypothetical protein